MGKLKISGYLDSLTPELTLLSTSVNYLFLLMIPLENKETSYFRDISSRVTNSKAVSIFFLNFQMIRVSCRRKENAQEYALEMGKSSQT